MLLDAGLVDKAAEYLSALFLFHEANPIYPAFAEQLDVLNDRISRHCGVNAKEKAKRLGLIESTRVSKRSTAEGAALGGGANAAGMSGRGFQAPQHQSQGGHNQHQHHQQGHHDHQQQNAKPAVDSRQSRSASLFSNLLSSADSMIDEMLNNGDDGTTQASAMDRAAPGEGPGAAPSGTGVAQDMSGVPAMNEFGFAPQKALTPAEMPAANPPSSSSSSSSTSKDSENTAKSRESRSSSSSSAGGLFGSLRGLFSSEEDKKKIAKGEGSKMEAYYDKAQGRYVLCWIWRVCVFQRITPLSLAC